MSGECCYSNAMLKPSVVGVQFLPSKREKRQSLMFKRTLENNYPHTTQSKRELLGVHFFHVFNSQ